ncbi:MAG: hypothetical protein JETCAE03_34840 [Ignavibacteriaceae bacterium]|jgi:hypothetical protein|nr:MAG: hypothetical protein JETCAE03_34840 [Ignavibacteriaceae bacterium]
MRNLRMQEKINSGECIDLSECQKTPEGYYIVKNFIDGIDYCNAQTEEWIWSIGINNETNEIHASHSANLYENPKYKCIWLR